jgi:hypothetical protein
MGEQFQCLTYYDISKHEKPLTQQYSVTSHNFKFQQSHFKIIESDKTLVKT